MPHNSNRQRGPEVEPLLTPAEVAILFRVDPKTVTRWAKDGKLDSIRTLGGHRRYRESDVRALLQDQRPTRPKRHTVAPYVAQAGDAEYTPQGV